MNWMIMPLQRYADFEGRSRRTEYWMFALFQVVVVIVLMALCGAIGAATGMFTSAAWEGGQVPPALWLFIAVFSIYYLAVLIPSIAVAVRRFHDQNLSGWMYCLGFVPYVGPLIVFIFMLIPGTVGPNRYGPDPKGGIGQVADVFR